MTHTKIKIQGYLQLVIVLLLLVIAAAFVLFQLPRTYPGNIGEIKGLEGQMPDQENLYTETVDKTSWELQLVNKDNPLPSGFVPTLATLDNGLKFDERAIADLKEMLDQAKKSGLSPVVCSAYRTADKQEKIYSQKVISLMDQGHNEEKANDLTSKRILPPGTSEHSLGLAVDIVASSYQILDDHQETTAEAQWLLNHCSEYGFILRYPENKTQITNVDYEPWHFRYVGKTAAREIMESGLCLEEYLETH